MAVPSREEAVRLLRDLNPDEWLWTHSAGVGEVAAFLAKRISERGHAIFGTVVETAAVLHDLDKALPLAHPLKQLRHGEAGAAWLREGGYGELAAAVANHPVTRLADDDHWRAWTAGATIEERIVAYADKRFMQELVPMDVRFAYWFEKHGKTDAMLVAKERAQALEAEVCGAAGVEPQEVELEAWVR